MGYNCYEIIMTYKWAAIILPAIIFLAFSAGAQSTVTKTTDQPGRSVILPDNPLCDYHVPCFHDAGLQAP